MSKRHLNDRQLRRISRNQQRRQTRADSDAMPAERNSTVDTEKGSDDLGPEQEGLVICHFGQQMEIESRAPETQGRVFRCYQRTNLPPIVTGDRVTWQPDSDSTGVVVAVNERRSVLYRPNPQGTLRPVASNIDLVAIVIAPLPQPFSNLVDRYLVAAESLGLKPIIILNKIDLMNAKRDIGIVNMLSTYQEIGYEVLRLSTQTGEGMDDLTQWLAKQTVVFVGQSGVGKSSLINALLPESEAAVGSLSTARDKGTHTTTAARLFHLADSGDLVDSPGIREFGLWHMDQQQLIEGFVEFRPFLGRCKFRDCSHQREPGCALMDGVKKGHITDGRLQSYFQILNTLSGDKR